MIAVPQTPQWQDLLPAARPAEVAATRGPSAAPRTRPRATRDARGAGPLREARPTRLSPGRGRLIIFTVSVPGDTRGPISEPRLGMSPAPGAQRGAFDRIVHSTRLMPRRLPPGTVPSSVP